MKREDAIERILDKTGLSQNFRGYVERTLDKLGCGECIDLDTMVAIADYIKKDLQ